MAINKGFLTSDRTASGDECFTPFYAVDPILEFIPKGKTVWLPFDEEWSAFTQRLVEGGVNIIRTSLKEGYDFFEYEPKEYDLIISNPPFSRKDDVLERLYKLGKPFMILLPTNSIQSIKRVNMFIENGLELLCFDKRISYHTNFNFENYTKGNSFGSCYFCKDILPEKLMFRKLKEYDRKLK